MAIMVTSIDAPLLPNGPSKVLAMTSPVGTWLRSVSPAKAAILAGLGGLTLWLYWPALSAMSERWVHDPQYSHGYLVPAFAGVLLWLRRSLLPAAPGGYSGWGLLLMLAGALLLFAGVYTYFDWLEAASLTLWLAGICVLLGGWGALRWAWPAIAFLLFMIPLPYRVENALSHPLQSLATRGSTYLMQTVGLAALAEGNTIVLGRGRIGVVEACNGLSMMLIFFALATALAIVVNRPLLDRVIILLSAAPIAVIANVLRITATGAAQELISPEAAHAIFHDWAGWLMMPVALGLLAFELWLLGRILVERQPSDDAAAVLPGPIGAVGDVPPQTNGKPRKHEPSQRRTIPAPPTTRRR
jgi:exosortase